MSLFRANLPEAKADPLIARLRQSHSRGTSLVACLECGANNIVANKICGACGANLPRILDDEGQPRQATPQRVDRKVMKAHRGLAWRMILVMCLIGFAAAYRGCSAA